MKSLGSPEEVTTPHAEPEVGISDSPLQDPLEDEELDATRLPEEQDGAAQGGEVCENAASGDVLKFSASTNFWFRILRF